LQNCRLSNSTSTSMYPCLLSTLASQRAAGINGVPRKSIVVDPFRCWNCDRQ
jgi:hypothetical protein